MMRLSAERLWIIGGAVAVVVLLAIGWFFMVSPKYAETDSLNSQAAATGGQVTVLQQRLAALRKQNQNMPAYLAQLAKERAALPSTSGLSDLLRELQTAGDATGAAVSGVSVGGVTDVTAGGAKLYALPLTLTVTGSVPQLRAFLVQLQQIQPRAVLITSANLSTSENADPSANPGTRTSPAASTIALSMKAFVAPGATGAVVAPGATGAAVAPGATGAAATPSAPAPARVSASPSASG
jgi:Tfp pilus assembly protein PilO